jgi:hypothetical protein
MRAAQSRFKTWEDFVGYGFAVRMADRGECADLQARKDRICPGKKTLRAEARHVCGVAGGTAEAEPFQDRCDS